MHQWLRSVMAWGGVGCLLAGGRIAAHEPPTRDPASAQQAPKLASAPAPEPDEALRNCEIIPGFRLELAAHEPQVVDPVAAAFDADGRLYVAEMRDYPFRPQPNAAPLGTIRLLEDRDDDGRFETSTLFAEGLLWPTGVQPWRGGVFVTAAPNIWYFKDTDGDGRADEKRHLFSGFGTQNEQGSVNNLVWGLDNRIYGTSSKNGGLIRDSDERTPPLEIHGHDFCFDPRTLVLEPISGNSQFGIALDDWGNRFLCDQANPCSHVVLPERYLRRNPQARIRTAVNDLAPGAVPSFRSSPIEGWRAIRSTRRLESGERAASSTGLSHDVLDGVAGPAIYRGDAFPPEFRGQLFVGDAQSNLVHRRVLKPSGVTFTSERADPGTEFVRSRDNWFRPVNVLNAPDGTLYVLDMSREVIESVHVPLDVFKRIDYTRGRDRGRIYRIVPAGYERRARPALSTASLTELVAQLEHPSGWWRDTAQRLLYERRDPAAIEPLQKIVAATTRPEARLHGLYALAGLDALTAAELSPVLSAAEPGLREHAVRLAEPLLGGNPQVRAAILLLADDPEPRVRMQVAFTLGELARSNVLDTQAIDALATIALRDGADPWIRAAIFSSSSTCSDRLLERVIAAARHAPEIGALPAVLGPLAELTGRTAPAEALAATLDTLATARPPAPPALRDAVLVGIATGRRSSGAEFQAWIVQLTPAARTLRDTAVREAVAVVQDPSRSASAREQALALLGCGEASDVLDALADVLASPTSSASLKQAALRSLGSFTEPEPAQAIITSWPVLAPAVREAAIGVLLSRPAWTRALVAAVATGSIAPSQVSATQRSMLLGHPQPEIALQAQAIWNDSSSPRREVIVAYQAALEGNADAMRGSAIYERECAACHQLGTRGHAVGPNLALARHRDADELLIHILDPNREVQPAYIQYVVTDTRGGIFAGLIAADTATGVTLRQDRSQERTILRAEIDELASTDKSLMPEGFEKTIKPGEMADLIAFLVQVRYQTGTEPGHTEPEGSTPLSSVPADAAPVQGEPPSANR